MFASLGGMALGFLLGLRHAFEPDHLSAVTTLALESRRSRNCVWLGAVWGVGHTLSVVALGTALLVTGTVLPARAEAGFELGVALMLVALGARSLYIALRDGGRGMIHRHRHGADEHVHRGPESHVHVAGRALAWRPLLVGLVHGLAGTGAVTALVVAQMSSFQQRVLYLILFGFGSIAGMALASGVAGASLERAVNTPARYRAVFIASGAISLALGIVWAAPELSQL